MNARWIALACILSSLAHAQATATVQVIATDPAGSFELSAREPLYARIAYSSDSPLRFQAGGFLAGSEVLKNAAMNPAPLYPAGEGEAVAWVAYDNPVRIDEIRIRVFDDDWTERDSISHKLDVTWSGATSARRTPAAWATQLNASQQQMTETASLGASDDGDTWIVPALMFAGWSVPGYWILQVCVWRRYREGWRKWALLPLWITLPLLAYTLFALLAGSNLWPLMMIFITPFAFIYLVGVVMVKIGRERYGTQRG